MSRRILTDTVSLFNYAGESIEGEAQYIETVVKYCYCPSSQGVVNNTEGKAPEDGAKLFIFDRDSICKGIDGTYRTFIECDAYEKLEDKSAYWTLSDRGRDYFMKKGDYNKHFLKSFSHKVAGTKRMWHWEVTGT